MKQARQAKGKAKGKTQRAEYRAGAKRPTYRASESMQEVADRLRRIAEKVEHGDYPRPANLVSSLEDFGEDIFSMSESTWGLVPA